ncbi:ATP-binding cassette domain-containing protein [Cellulomonas hominis]
MELVALSRTFPGDPLVQALRPSDLRIEAGEYVSVVGPSGSGKSTLLHILGLLDRPTTGEYLLDGVPTGNLDTVNSQGVLDLFDELHADGLTLLVITHDAAVSARAQRRVRITDGRLTEVA